MYEVDGSGKVMLGLDTVLFDIVAVGDTDQEYATPETVGEMAMLYAVAVSSSGVADPVIVSVPNESNDSEETKEP